MTKKTATAKAAVPTTEPKAPKAASNGDSRIAHLTPGERRIALVKSLRKLRATSRTGAKTLAVVAEDLGCTRAEVYGLVNGTSGKAGSSPTCLAATGHVETYEHEAGLSIFATDKGKSTKFTEPPFVRATKAADSE